MYICLINYMQKTITIEHSIIMMINNVTIITLTLCSLIHTSLAPSLVRLCLPQRFLNYLPHIDDEDGDGDDDEHDDEYDGDDGYDERTPHDGDE